MTDTNLLIIDNLTDDQIKRLFSKIEPDFETGCWNWTGYTGSTGYGHIRIDKILYRTHRLMYAWFVGPLPTGKGKDIPVVDHICNNRLCCNPSHLQLISDTENILKGNGATAAKFRQTHCHNGHPLPNAINGHRRCMACNRAWNRSNYAKKPEFFRAKVNARRNVHQT